LQFIFAKYFTVPVYGVRIPVCGGMIIAGADADRGDGGSGETGGAKIDGGHRVAASVGDFCSSI